MGKLKDRLYDLLVRKDVRVGNEYERYVQEHLVEHYENRFRHWKVLWQLNWHYRVKKCNEPLLYWVPEKEEKGVQHVREKGSKSKPDKTKSDKLPYLDGAESRTGNWIAPAALLRQLVNYDMISFDIFDTLIFRPLEKPQDLFWIVGAKLGVLGFPSMRSGAELHLRERANELKGNREITLHEIYEYLEKTVGIDAEVGMKTELQAEMEYCYVNPYMKYIFDHLIAAGKRVVLVSDMYISAADMESLLSQMEILGYEKMFISCDYKCSKRDGTLYQKVIEYANVPKEKIIHIGDNPVSDIESPGKYGMSAYYYPNVNKTWNKYRTKEIPGLVGSAYRGIVNAYLHNGYRRYDVYYEYGFVYGGLFALGYAEYISDYVKKNQIERVLFVARDGYVLKKVYDSLFPDARTDYILSSRISNLKLSAYKNKGDFFKEFVYRFVSEKIPISIKEVLENMELGELLEDAALQMEIEQLLDDGSADGLVAYLNDKWNDIVMIYEKGIAVSRDYYAGFFENTRSALIVDIGWRGQGIIALRNLEEDYWHFGCTITGMLAASAPTRANLGQIYEGIIDTYMFSPVKYEENFRFHSVSGINNILMELFAGAPSPSFLGISGDGKNYKLKFDVPEVSNYKIIESVHMGIMDFVEEYKSHFGQNEYMMHVSGYDAYMPIKHIFKDYRLVKKYFRRYEFQDCVGGTRGNSSRRLSQIFMKFKL